MRSLKLRYKFIAMLLPLALAVLFFSSLHVSKLVETKQNAGLTIELVSIANISNNLVHELQKERGMTAGFLGSKGEQFASAIVQQRLKTDAKLQALQDYIASHPNSINQALIENKVSRFLQAIQKLSNTRIAVDNQSITLKSALAYYTNNNTQLLSIGAAAAELSDSVDLSQSLLAYYNFAQAKERAGIERAVLANTFGAGKFGPAMYEKLLRLISEQNTYFSSFALLAHDENQVAYKQLINGASFIGVSDYRQKAMRQELQQDPTAWF